MWKIAELTDAFEEICKSECVLKSFEVSELKEDYPKDKCFSPRPQLVNG